jgi:signal transduction histidine kinase
MRERAQLQGGSFDLLSHLGQGATIRVLLPLPEAPT